VRFKQVHKHQTTHPFALEAYLSIEVLQQSIYNPVKQDGIETWDLSAISGRGHLRQHSVYCDNVGTGA
jgi:hypothetical protein